MRRTDVILLNNLDAHAWSAVSPILLELARLRIAMLIGNQAGLLRRSNAAREAGVSESKIALISSYPSSREFSRIEKDCLEFTELFVIDVSSLTEDNLTALRSHFSAEQLPIFVMALYVTECTQRLEMVAPRLLDALPHVASEESVDARFAGLMQAMDAYQESVVRGTALDAAREANTLAEVTSPCSASIGARCAWAAPADHVSSAIKQPPAT